MKKAFIITFTLLSACGEDASKTVPQQQNGQVVALTDADIEPQRKRCIDDQVPILQEALDRCLAAGVIIAAECRGRFNTEVLQLSIIWNSIKGYAMADYNSCLGNPLTATLLGEQFCRAEFFKDIEQRIADCEGRWRFIW